MALSAGTKLGPFEILGPLAAGGMGEVYRAHDPKLARDVALKVLPLDLAEDAERRRRFEQEARAASSLNHPNIVHVYEIGAEGPLHYIAMELVEGRPMRELMTAAPILAKRMLEIAVEIADGLAKAHAGGIVHRDLKPDNVLITHEGHVKILDFGLAKVALPAGPSSIDGPTVSRTAAGLILGTVGYMSPEQAAGSPVDHTSDQFALGAILYEWASGRKPFQKPTTAETLVAIIKEAPEPLTVASPTLPAPLRWIIEDRLLAKDPKERYSSTWDLLRDLRSLRDHFSEASEMSGLAPSARGSGRRWPRGFRTVATLGLIFGILGGFLGGQRTVKPPLPARFHQLTFARGTVHSARFAPDGDTVIYGGAFEGRAVEPFLTRVGTPEARSLGLAGANVLAISPSGEMAVALDFHFVGGWRFAGTLARVALAGGSPRPLQEDVEFADFGPDGTSLAIVRKAQGRTRLEYPIGTVLYETAGWISEPRVSPDGNQVAFLDHPFQNDNMGLAAVVDRTGSKRTLGRLWASSQGLFWAAGGGEIWFTAAESGNSLAIRAVTLEGRERLVQAVPGALILQDISAKGRVLVLRATYRNAALGLPPGTTRERDLSAQIWSIPVDLSADGRTLLISEQGESAPRDYAVYLRHTDGESPAVLLGEGAALALSPDGRWVLASTPSQPRQLSVLPTGAGEMRRLPDRGIEYQTWASFLPDGRSIACTANQPGRGVRLYVHPLGEGAARAFSPEGVSVPYGVQPLAPDGSRVAALDPSGKPTFYSLATGEATPIPGTESGDVPVRLSADQRYLYVFHVVELPARIFKVELRTGRRELWKEIAPEDRAGLPFGLRNVLMTPDGKASAYSLRRLFTELFVAEGLK
jgi:Tol biopolymer transport system component